MYTMSNEEILRMERGINAALAIPLIDSIEDYIWEAIFAEAKKIPLVDPLTNIRSKRLFDLVDPASSVGWSAKAVQCPFQPGCDFDLVIQRADIFKKHAKLGFSKLTLDSAPEELGAALLKHWHDKVDKDAKIQGVTDKRVCILLKTKDYSRYAVLEEELTEYSPDDLVWRWTDSKRVGLQGFRKTDGFSVYRWYPNQKQFFERFHLPTDAVVFNFVPKRVPLREILCFLNWRSRL